MIPADHRLVDNGYKEDLERRLSEMRHQLESKEREIETIRKEAEKAK